MKSFLNALGFLTIISIPDRYAYQKDLSPALSYFPLIGLLAGAVLAFSFWVFSLFIPPGLAVILVVGLEAVLTGGLHYDGLADVFDGIFSGTRDRQKMLAIMKKSDIGTFGVLAVVLMLLLKAALIYFLYAAFGSRMVLFAVMLSFMPAWGRWSMVYLINSYPPARKEGSLAALFYAEKNNRRFAVCTLYTLIAFLGLAYLAHAVWGSGHAVACAGPFSQLIPVMGPILRSLVIFLAGFLVLIFAGQFFTKRLGGVNGDILGAGSVVTEVVYLLAALLVWTYL